MAMQLTFSRGVRVLAIVGIALAVAACANKPKSTGSTAAGVAGTAAPGSSQDFVVNVGDRVFFYHSVNEKRIVGIVEVAREYYPDPTDASSRFGMVDVKALMPLNKPVSLADIKGEPKLQDLALIRQSRLSVMPIDDDSWALICHMGETKA